MTGVQTCALPILVTSNHLFTSRDFSFQAYFLPSCFFFIPSSLSPQLLCFLLHCCSMASSFHEKEGNILPLLLKAKVLPGWHRARCRRLWITQPSFYGIPGTPLTCSSLRCPTARLLLPLTPGCFLVSLGLLVPPRFYIQGRFWIYRLNEDPAWQSLSSSTLSRGRLLVSPVGWARAF